MPKDGVPEKRVCPAPFFNGGGYFLNKKLLKHIWIFHSSFIRKKIPNLSIYFFLDGEGKNFLIWLYESKYIHSSHQSHDPCLWKSYNHIKTLRN